MRFVVGSRNGSRGRVSPQGTGHSLMTGGLSATGVTTVATTAEKSNAFMWSPFAADLIAALRRPSPPLLSRQHSSLQRRQPPSHRSVEDAVADAYHYPAEDFWVCSEVGPDLPSQGLRQPLDHRLLRAPIGLSGERDAGVHAVQPHIQ